MKPSRPAMSPRRFASSVPALRSRDRRVADVVRPFALNFAAFLSLFTSGIIKADDEKAAAPEPVKPAAALEAKPSLGDAITKNIRAVTDEAGGAICRVEADDEHGRLAGTGFLLDNEGTIVTSCVLGTASDELIVTIGEDKHIAKRLVCDSKSGIAILKIETDEPLPFLKLGSAAGLEVGTPVLALGYPLELPLSPSFGVVAGFNSGFQGRYFATRHLRVNAAIQRGEGGAPLLNLDGEVVGVLISSLDGGSGLFALPVDAVKKVLRDYKLFGRVRPGWLGADVRVTDAPERGSTARLRALRSDGPGAKGGLRAGDVLLQVGQWKIASPDDVFNAAFYVTAEKPLAVKVSRAGKVITFTVTPSDPPDGEGPKIYREQPAYLGSAEK